MARLRQDLDIDVEHSHFVRENIGFSTFTPEDPANLVHPIVLSIPRNTRHVWLKSSKLPSDNLT